MWRQLYHFMKLNKVSAPLQAGEVSPPSLGIRSGLQASQAYVNMFCPCSTMFSKVSLGAGTVKARSN